MEDERRRKIEAGREKLAAYKKRKTGEKRSESDHSSLSHSDTSLSLSPLPLSDNTNQPKAVVDPGVAHSGSSSISENIELSNSENDRSYQEILVANIPLDSPDLSLNSVLPLPVETQPIRSLHNSLISDSSVISLNALEKFELENNNFLNTSQNILDEIIRHDQFDSKSESDKSHLFDDLSSITLKSEHLKTSQSDSVQNDSKTKVKEHIPSSNHRDAIMTQVSGEIDSLKEINSSNPSTLSLGTSTTEYKQYFDKVNLGTIEFQDLISHRDDHIKQLTEALKQVLEDRNHLQEQTDYFAQEIADLKEQLIQTTAIIKKNNWNLAFSNDSLSVDGRNEKNFDENAPQNFHEDSESTSHQSLANDLSVNQSRINFLCATEINFDFEDPEFNDTMTPEEKKIVSEMRNKINLYIQQKVDECKIVYESEIKVLKDQLEHEKKLNTKNKFELSNKKTEDSLSSLQSEDNQMKSVENESTITQKPKQMTNTTFEDDPMFNETFSPEEISVIADIRTKIYMFIQQKIESHKCGHESELKILKDRLENEKISHATEVESLRKLVASVKSGSTEIAELREGLNEIHSKEMEELRTYFEQRCADIEKHYSEEIFSQQSRKMSGSSIGSDLESEIYPPQPGPCGDNTTTEPVKSDLSSLRIELQNKYHAELEILREDYENRLDELKINHHNLVQDLEQKYVTQIETLKSDLEEAQKNAATTQEVASSGDFEIVEVVESYERRLQEQVMLAKIDIISALEQQIQTLVSNTAEDLEWPAELLQLRDRLTEHWHSEIQEIKVQHAQEISRLKEDHEKSLARALERERRNSLKSLEDPDVKKERDNLKRVTSNLRHLVAELIKYFTKCEDELNNTLVEELLKYGFDKDLSRLESDFNDTSQSGSDQPDALAVSPRVKRVHFTPDVSGMINFINDTTLDTLDTTKDISSEFRTELDLCLERLKSEANAILSLTSNLKLKPIESGSVDETKPVATEEKLTSLTRQLITETQVKNELNIQLEETKGYIQNLEADKLSLEVQLEQMMAKQQVLVSELNNAKEKISDLIESGRKEIVSEGYGENQITGATTLGGRIASLAELQERARIVLAEAEPTSGHPLLQLLEELCRESDRIMEDAKKDHEDLVQQIEAADKKLRATTQFLEDQAVDRELERDEAQKEIAALKEQLRDGERTRVSCERINKEESQGFKLNACTCDFSITVVETMERLESQMREMSVLMANCEAKKNEVENELKEAIDKIWVLRDIIRTLESQVEDKTKVEVDLKNIIIQLEEKINDESKQNEELSYQIDSLKNCPENNNEIIRKLESEIQKLRVSSELVGPDGVLKQVKTQLNEIEKTLEKRTKDLEGLHTVISNTNCSSPSEDMSIRDQIRPVSSNETDSDLPLEQLARLKDKLIRHARAEDAAMKRIRDLEMQLYTSKQDYEEMQSERDVLQDQLSEQMVLISSLQLRLDEQRLRVEAAHKQSNISFEHKIYELENEIQELKETIHNRDKNIKQLTTAVDQTKQRLADQQKQLNSASDIEKQMVEQFQAEINRLNLENDALRARKDNNPHNVESSVSLSQTTSNTSTNATQTALTNDFLDAMLTDKNADIEMLREKLNEIEKELYFYASLNLSKEQLAQLSSSVSTGKSHGLTSIIESSEPDQLRRQELSFDSLHSGENLEFKRNMNETAFIGSTFRDSKYEEKHLGPFIAPELSTIEKIGPPCVNFTVEECQLKPIEGVCGDSKTQKHVHFQENLDLTKLESKISELQNELDNKNETLKSYEDKLSSMSDYVVDLENLRKKLQFSEDTIRENTENFKDEIDSMKEAEKNLRVELAEAKMELQQRISKLEALEKDMVRKDQMYMNLAKEKLDLEKKIVEMENKFSEFRNYENIMAEKNQEIYELERQLTEITDSVNIDDLKEQIGEKEAELNHLKNQLTILQQTLTEKEQEAARINAENQKFKQELSEKNELLEKNDKEHKNIISQCNELTSHITQLNELLTSRTATIAKMEDDLEKERQQRDIITKYEEKIHELEATVSEYETKLEAIKSDNAKVSTSNLELELSRYKKQLAEKELQLLQDKSLMDALNKEVHHLEEYLKEKDKIIKQMSVDSNSLHVALEAIQSKMQESGNVVDLKKRLREEQTQSNSLREELNYIKQSIEQYEYMESTNITETLVLLKESVEREKLTNQELRNTKEELLLDVQQLKQKLTAEEETVQKLQRLLDEEKAHSHEVQEQDANIIEAMRLRLEALVDNENESEKQLTIERKTREELEKQLMAANQKTGSFSLESHLKSNDANAEITYLKLDLVKLTTENELLKSDLTTVRNLHALLKSELKQYKDINEAQKLEINQLKQQLDTIKLSEVEEKANHSRSKKDLQRQRSTESNTTRLLLSQLEAEKLQMRNQIEELKDSLKKVRNREQELSTLLLLERNKQMDSPVPEKFLHKIKELTSLLQGHIADNKQMSSTLAHLTDERRALQNRVKELEGRLNINSPFDDPVARADHLFGRCLKSESYRKALIFQKRYLLTLLASYQRGSSTNLAKLNFVLPRVHTSKPVNKFRAAVFAVISIRRMQYIVQRWHTGKRIGASVVLKKPVVPPSPSPSLAAGSSHLVDSRPWAGNSPPSKDRTRKNAGLPLGNTIQESISLAPLQAPALLSQYIERFDNIQQRLGLALDRSGT